MDKINVYDNIVIRNCKKEIKYGNKKKVLHKSPSKRWFRDAIHGKGALTSFTSCNA